LVALYLSADDAQLQSSAHYLFANESDAGRLGYIAKMSVGSDRRLLLLCRAGVFRMGGPDAVMAGYTLDS
jgi:hypothetical protein